MMTYNENGLNAGLNKGLKVGKMLKKNVRLKNVNLKNTIKVVKLGTTVASFVPGASAVGKGLSILEKAKKTGAGRFAMKLANSKLAKKGIALKNSQIGRKLTSNISLKNLTKNKDVPATETNYGSSSANFDAPEIQQGDGGYLQTQTFKPVYNMPVSNVMELASTQRALEQPSDIDETPLPVETKDNTMIYVGGAIVVAGIIYLATKKNN